MTAERKNSRRETVGEEGMHPPICRRLSELDFRIVYAGKAQEGRKWKLAPITSAQPSPRCEASRRMDGNPNAALRNWNP